MCSLVYFDVLLYIFNSWVCIVKQPYFSLVRGDRKEWNKDNTLSLMAQYKNIAHYLLHKSVQIYWPDSCCIRLITPVVRTPASKILCQGPYLSLLLLSVANVAAATCTLLILTNTHCGKQKCEIDTKKQFKEATSTCFLNLLLKLQDGIWVQLADYKRY